MVEFNALAGWWFFYFSTHMLEVSAFILMVLVLDHLVIKNTTLRYGLWCLALLKLFLPPLISLPQTVQQPALQTLAAVSASLSPVKTAAEPLSLSWQAVLMTIWLLSVVCLTVLFVSNNIRLYWRLSRAQRVTQTALEAQGVEIFQSPAIRTPVLLGILKPRLYLPEAWTQLTARQLRALIEHEKAHIENRDLLVLLLQYCGVVLFCVNPLVWLMHHRLNTLRELRCDEAAMAQSGTNPLRYSKFLIEIAARSRGRFEQAFLVGENFANKKKTMQTRIYHLLNYEESKMKKKTLFQCLAFALAAALIVPFSWNCSKDTSENPTADSQKTALQMQKQNYDVPPQVVGGFAEISKHLSYPEIGRKAGIEGRVILMVSIDEEGKLTDVRVLKKINDGKAGFEESAANAVRAVRWKPAERAGKPVASEVAIPVIFRLNGAAQSENPEPGEAAFDTPPTPVGGFEAISKQLQYPESARENKIEGRVLVKVQISETGELLQSTVLQSVGNEACDQAALHALQAVSWKPAEKAGHSVKAEVVVPVIFRLH